MRASRLELKDAINPIKIEEPTENPLAETFPIEEVTVKEEEGEDECEFLVECLEDERPIKTDPKKRSHSKKTENPCNFCDKVFSTWAELNEHKKADHLQCPICLRSFASFRIMTHHKVNSHAGDTHCHICGKYLKSRLYLAAHIRKAHNNERNHKCDICGKDFFRSFALKDHLSTHNEVKSEICDFENCGKAFKNVINLKAHKKTHIPEGSPSTVRPKVPSKEFVCQCCGKILKSTTGYDIHMRIHRNEKPFECKTCGKTFGAQTTLTVHERVHQNIRPYQCDQCPLKFKTWSNMKNHKISIHETEMKHECHICGKRTKMKSNLTLHMKTHGIGKNKNDLD